MAYKAHNQSRMHLLARCFAGWLCIASWSANGNNWHSFSAPTQDQAESIGKYSNGCLLGGSELPDAGVGYQTVRLARKRNFAHPDMVSYIQDLGQRVSKRGLGIMLVADMAMPRGGRFTSGHRSHQSGLDADIWLRLDTPVLPTSQRQSYGAVEAYLFVNRKHWTVTPNFRWKHAELIRQAALDDRVARIFVNPAIKKNLCERQWNEPRDWLRKVRPWWGHDAHFHVRLSCPQGSTDCEDQAEPPPGEGCGEEVESWLVNLRKPKKRGPKPNPAATPAPPPPPPTRCQLVLDRSD